MIGFIIWCRHREKLIQSPVGTDMIVKLGILFENPVKMALNQD